jgi:hypothetical protein
MSSFEPEYLEVLNFAAKSFMPIPTRTIQVKQNQIVASLKSSGIWNSLDRFYVYTNDAFEGYKFARINWKNPSSTTNVTLVNIQYNSTYGVRSEIVNTGYVNTNFNLSTNGTGFTSTANTICVGYDNLVGPSSGGTVYGAYTGSSSINQVSLITGSGMWTHQSNNSDFPTLSAGTLLQAARLQVTLSGGTVYQYQNGSLVRSVTPVQIGQLPNLFIFNCAINNNGTPEFNGQNYVKYFAVGAPFNASTFDGIMNTYYL